MSDQDHSTGRFNPRAKTPVLTEYMTGWAPDPLWTFSENRKSFPLPEFEPRTVQPVARRYTGGATE